MWIRNVRATATFDCCYPATQSIVMPKSAERKVFITQNFTLTPRKTLINWAKDIVRKKVRETGDESCAVHSLDVCKKITIVDIDYWEELPKEVFVAGVVYRIIRQRSRGQVHIYGLTNKQYFSKMSEKGYTQTQARQLLKLFSEGKVKTEAKV